MPLPVYTTTEEGPAAGLSDPQAEPKQGGEAPTKDLALVAISKRQKAELAAEKLYEERMEDEYAKREGGA